MAGPGCVLLTGFLGLSSDTHTGEMVNLLGNFTQCRKVRVVLRVFKSLVPR